MDSDRSRTYRGSRVPDLDQVTPNVWGQGEVEAVQHSNLGSDSPLCRADRCLDNLGKPPTRSSLGLVARISPDVARVRCPLAIVEW